VVHSPPGTSSRERILQSQKTVSGAGEVKDFTADLTENDIEEASDGVGSRLCTPVVISLDDIVRVD
jgi:hypothetical protein